MNQILSQTIITLFLCGDVMTGRGIDQVLEHSAPRQLYEPYVRDAQRYVELAERTNGPIPRPVTPAYVWGDALAELQQRRPAVKIINLETSITAGGKPWPDKSIHYRMHPGNASLLQVAGIDIAVLANNHVLDWGQAGLVETLDTLHRVGVRTSGAGGSPAEAAAPAVVEGAAQGRVIVFSFGIASSGIPKTWAAAANRPGVNLLTELSAAAVSGIAEAVERVRRPGDVVVASIHWGGNWGYTISTAHREFAHLLIDRGGIDLVHGHSSHHALGIEVYRGKLILYGCGDLVTDYEGIGGHEEFRGDLGVMYFPRIDTATGRLVALEMVPMQMKQFRLGRATREDAGWLGKMFNREGQLLGTWVETRDDGTLILRWAEEPSAKPGSP